MKRFHVHVSVEDLAQSVRFYSTPIWNGFTPEDVWQKPPPSLYSAQLITYRR